MNYPVGTRVTYTEGDTIYTGTVLTTPGYPDRRYWVGLDDDATRVFAQERDLIALA